jgi:hypothetical protein
MMTTRQILELVSVCAAFTSGMLLYYGSLGIPWGMQSWSGESPAELRMKRKQTLMVWVGVPCAIIAFVVQVVIILCF